MALDNRSGQRFPRLRAGAGGLALLLLVLIAACRAPPKARPQVGPSAGPAGATQYQLDADASQLWLYLHAAGPLVRLGHTHVISTHALEGSVWIPAQLEHTSCAFELPVTGLLVDDPQERSAAGGEFAEPLDEDARAGTREHMLGERQLDSAHYPLLSLRCQQVSVLPDGLLLQLAVSVRDHEARLAVPVQWQREGCSLRASGEFSFLQSELGIEPYSLLLGALRVDHEVRARFQLTLHCLPAASG